MSCSAFDVFVAIFRNEGGHYIFRGHVNGIFGMEPQRAAFSKGRVVLTTFVARGNDAICFPKHKQTFNINLR